MEVTDVVVRLRRDTGRTVVVVLLDVNLAARCSDHLVVTDGGQFGLSAHVFPDPVDRLQTVVPTLHG
ncbi:hypothetical protein [Mumia zhuanghuii]|uniref:hypothetical protein n=1 Tax=Mumia zhuanghuii TaxID=2585211 RepID=UPI001891DB8C|nr:hypothetical protein [Mumia zhuanghuii]